MAIMHQKESLRVFRPNPNIKGGSKKGKPQEPWELIYVVVGDAVVIQRKGTVDAILRDASLGISTKELTDRVERILPGSFELRAQTCRNYGERTGRFYKEPVEKTIPGNFRNRIQKQYYSGTSARGKNHDPRTRWCISEEHWTRKIPSDHVFYRIHDDIVTGKIQVLSNWKDYLEK